MRNSPSSYDGGSVCVAKLALDDSVEHEKVPKISDLQSLSTNLPFICKNIFQQLGSQQLEAAYQRCLKIDLEEAGLNVLMEPEIELTYKGYVVGTRRPDLILTTESGEKAVLELKAVDKTTPEHMKQLEFYLHRTSIARGYLINFPHDTGFTAVDDNSIFSVTTLSGLMEKVSLLLTGAPTLRLRNAPDKRPVEILQVHRRDMTSEESARKKVAPKQAKPEGVFGIKKDGITPCTVCIKQQRYCHMHRYQQNE